MGSCPSSQEPLRPLRPRSGFFCWIGSRRQVGQRHVPRVGSYIAQFNSAGGDKVVYEHVHLADDVAHLDSGAARLGGPLDRRVKRLRMLCKFGVGLRDQPCR